MGSKVEHAAIRKIHHAYVEPTPWHEPPRIKRVYYYETLDTLSSYNPLGPVLCSYYCGTPIRGSAVRCIEMSSDTVRDLVNGLGNCRSPKL